MKNIFILGVGRSGTTWLGDLVSLTKSPIKYLDEPFPKLKKDILLKSFPFKYKVPWFLPFDCTNQQLSEFLKVLSKFQDSNDVFRGNFLNHTLKKDDESFSNLLIKDVHQLGVYPRALANMPNTRIVIITRDTKRVVDSLFNTFGMDNNYLMSEYDYLKKRIRKNKSSGNIYIDAAIRSLSLEAISYFKKIHLFENKPKKLALIIHVISQSLILWANDDKRVLHVTHENLCLDIYKQIKHIYSHIELDYDSSILNMVKEKTTGSEHGSFDTSKNSLAVLNQKYRVLDNKMLSDIEKLNLNL